MNWQGLFLVTECSIKREMEIYTPEEGGIEEGERLRPEQ